uniref:Protein phosphatase 4, regulatory subunit 4 n=1 Tax=Salarias fasciatus TaxID=181472 RepID=A0A672HJI5_SALFA
FQTAEEMDQLTVDEDLNDMDRAVQLLSGQEVQRLSVLGNLPGLVRQNPAETFRRVVPKVRVSLRRLGDEDSRFSACVFCTDVPTVERRPHLVFNAWLETLLLAINALPKETIKQEVLSPLLYHSQTSHSLQSRLASCRILGKVASKFESHMVKQELLPLARSLCRDSESEVRALMCQGNATQHDATRRNTAQHDATRRNTTQHDATRRNTAQHDATRRNTTQHDATQRNTTQHDNGQAALIRRNCCYNLPALVAFSDPARFQSRLYGPFSRLCRDPDAGVRRGAAAAFHQVIQLLGPDQHLVHKELLVLLQDEDLEVLDALMNHLDETLEAVLAPGENRVPELPAALLRAEQTVGGSLRWRLQEKLLRRFAVLARLLPGDVLHQRFCPRILLILTSNKVLPVQKEAARTLCTFLRYNRRPEQRQETVDRLLQDLAQGPSCWNRLRFLDVCETAAEIFSRKYFKKHFLIPALDLVHDPVANVRYRLCQLLPRLRSALRLPADEPLLHQMDFCIQKMLCRETDRDVVSTIRKVRTSTDQGRSSKTSETGPGQLLFIRWTRQVQGSSLDQSSSVNYSTA